MQGCVPIQKNKMFGLFNSKKDPAAKLQKKYEKLMKEAYELSTVDRTASDKKYAEADQVGKEIELLSKDSA